MTDDEYMKEALKLAELALLEGEVPIGAVIVHKDEVIGKGYNMRNQKKNSLYHAEIVAINQACEKLGDWRLEECRMFVTTEPCPMCTGALIQSRITEVIFGVRNKKAGCMGSLINLAEVPGLNHKIIITEGLLEEEAGNLMSTFFKNLREAKATNNSY